MIKTLKIYLSRTRNDSLFLMEFRMLSQSEKYMMMVFFRSEMTSFLRLISLPILIMLLPVVRTKRPCFSNIPNYLIALTAVQQRRLLLIIVD